MFETEDSFGGKNMRFTSAEANKYLKELVDGKSMLQVDERQNSTFIAATIEDIEDVRPAFDLNDSQQQIRSVNEKIRKLKHAINLFNVQTVVDGFDMTIDEMLVYLPQLSQRVEELSRLSRLPAKERLNDRTSINLIEYRYANYDVQKARQLSSELFSLQHRAQTTLDLINNTVQFEVDL